MDIADELVEKVKAAALAPLRALAAVPAPEPPPAARRESRGPIDILVIGISTGGPQALKVLIPQLPADCPVPVAMVLHMPIGYTEMYAKKLDEMSALHVVEAKGEEPVVPGMVFLAPAGRHLTFRQEGGPGRDPARRSAARHAAPALGGRPVSRPRPTSTARASSASS